MICLLLEGHQPVRIRQFILPSCRWDVSAQPVRPLLEGHRLVRTVVAPLDGRCVVGLSPSGGTSAGPYTSIYIAVPPLGCQRAAGTSPSGGTPAGPYIRWVVGSSPSGGTPSAEHPCICVVCRLGFGGFTPGVLLVTHVRDLSPGNHTRAAAGGRGPRCTGLLRLLAPLLRDRRFHRVGQSAGRRGGVTGFPHTASIHKLAGKDGHYVTQYV